DAVVKDLRSPGALARFSPGGSATLAFTPDSRRLVMGGRSDLTFYEVGSWNRIFEISRGLVSPLPPKFSFTRDSRICAASLPPDRTMLLDMATGDELATLPAQ